MSRHTGQVGLPGMDEALRRDLEERVAEFEREHEPDVLRDGPGWVPRITARDYAVAVAVNAVIIVWLVLALMGGD